LEWIGDPLVGRGVVERRFDLTVDERLVPGIVWTPEGADTPRPLVLIGHGGSLHKRVGYVLSLARRLVRHHAYAAVAIDGPSHGERPGANATLSAGESLRTGQLPEWWTDATTDDMVADWKATLDAVSALPEVGAGGPFGYWGLSMGTIFGLPFVAAEPRLTAAVLGLMGIVGPTAGRIERDAKQLTTPVMFVLQSDDELFARPYGLALYDALATNDKRLHVNPGAHSAVPVDEYLATERFLVERLSGAVVAG
jgi:dienelactone hydrolase